MHVALETPSPAEQAALRSPAHSAEQTRVQPISRSLLLAFYAIVPVGVLVPLLDHFVLGGSLMRRLPSQPDDIFVWTIFFNVPHLVASGLLLLDGEYLEFYRRPLLAALGALAVFWVACLLVPPGPAVWIATAITVYHVLGQQVGITRLMGGGDPGPALVWYKIFAVLTALLAYAEIFQPLFHLGTLSLDTTILTVASAVALSLCAVQIWQRLKGWQARLYLLANHAMFLAFVPLASTGYAFFFLIMPRVVHDLSAFTFYIAHDTNRNRGKPRALLYRALGFSRIPPAVLLPGASIGIASVLTAVDPESALHPVALLSLFHYIMEAITWRRSGLHRHSIALA